MCHLFTKRGEDEEKDAVIKSILRILDPNYDIGQLQRNLRFLL